MKDDKDLEDKENKIIFQDKGHHLYFSPFDLNLYLIRVHEYFYILGVFDFLGLQLFLTCNI